ncbi:MAG: DoxX family protein [Pseudohongiellaceae bacterium]|nr:DoxX family protein [Pseudohongiellaceae bacterium]
MRSILKCFDALGRQCQSLSWAALRVISSLMFMTHGYGKMFGERAQPIFGGMDFFGVDVGLNMLWVAGVIEFFGGALLALGLYTRPLALLATILMAMAYLRAHAAWFPTLNNGELAAMYFLTYFSIFAFGPGKFSLDNKLFSQR